MHLMQDLNRQGITVVVITHENEVAGYASRQIHFRDGRIDSDSANPDLERATEPKQAAGGRA
jgi:putative ABC transport system ATP-binding protein